MRPTDIRLPGAVDLSGLKARGAPAASPPSAGGGDYVFDVTEATFQTDVVDRSRQVPVVLDFWAEWCAPCKQLSPVLERLAAEGNGRWVLAKIDVDANQQLAAAFQVQSIPSVFAVVGGRGLPLFQGAVPEQQVRAVLEEVLKVASANGVTGGGEGAAPPAGPPADPAYETAQQALDRGDLDAAAAAYREVLARNPADPLAKSALARCDLLARTRSVDERAAREQADRAPDDVAAQAAVSDIDMVTGRVDAAIDRLVEVVRRTAGDQRDQARQHLLELFEVLDPDDPRLAAGRRRLSNALF